jgi:hypothetical protein
MWYTCSSYTGTEEKCRNEYGIYINIFQTSYSPNYFVRFLQEPYHMRPRPSLNVEPYIETFLGAQIYVRSSLESRFCAADVVADLRAAGRSGAG